MKPLPLPRPLFYGIILVGMLVLFFVSLGTVHIGGIQQQPQSACMQTVHTIGLCMYSYANDNDGSYPYGKSSTEVFQKLLDGGYVSDPTLFYMPAAGKTKPLPGQKLKPENVSFDVTSGLTLVSPAELPVVFLTGYKVTYAPGGSAVPMIKPYPKFGGEARTWDQWWHGRMPRASLGPGIAVHYVANNSIFRRLDLSGDSADAIPNFISPDYKPDGKTYRQLTPGGVLLKPER